MKKELLAVFSGFPEHHFSEEITKRLRQELTVRKSIVFITACPLDYAQNNDDCDGMQRTENCGRLRKMIYMSWNRIYKDQQLF